MDYSKKMICIPYEAFNAPKIDENKFELPKIIKIIANLARINAYDDNFNVFYAGEQIGELSSILNDLSTNVDMDKRVVDLLLQCSIDPELINNKKIKENLFEKYKTLQTEKKSPVFDPPKGFRQEDAIEVVTKRKKKVIREPVRKSKRIQETQIETPKTKEIPKKKNFMWEYPVTSDEDE